MDFITEYNIMKRVNVLGREGNLPFSKFS